MANRFRDPGPFKIYLSESQVEMFREYALHKGRTEEWFNKWVEEVVVVVEWMDELEVDDG